nr:hypothetical protein [Tanacetum cinerariifolium]
MQRVGKEFSRVETPLFEGMLVGQEVSKGDAEVHDENINAGDAAEGDVSLAHGEVPNVDEEPSIPSPTPPTLPSQPSQDIPSTSQIAQALEISKLKKRVKKLERRNKVKVLKLKRLQKARTTQRVETSDETMMDDVSNQGRMIAKMDQDANVVLEKVKEVAEDAKVDACVDIQERKAESQEEIYKIDLGHTNKVLSIQEDKIEPTEVQEVVDVVTTAKIITETKEQTEKEKSRALKRINETPAESSKRQKLDEEVEELKRYLQIVPNEDDDVYTEATLLARKVPVVDYERGLGSFMEFG